jgi:hypothetical protein
VCVRVPPPPPPAPPPNGVWRRKMLLSAPCARARVCVCVRDVTDDRDVRDVTDVRDVDESVYCIRVSSVTFRIQ